MTTVAIIQSPTRSDVAFNPSSHFLLHSMADRRMSSANETSGHPTTLLLRKLPKNTTSDAVRTMLVFAKDLKATEIVPNEYDEDVGFATAVAMFSSSGSASEARVMLDGKPNTAGQAKMIVNVISGAALSGYGRRNTIDPVPSRKVAHSVSPPLSGAQKPSRFNETFQSIDKLSPPLVSPPPEQSPETNPHLQTIFSPQSPNATVGQDRRMTGKLVIGEDSGDDETGELLKDPLGYMNSNPIPHSMRKHPKSRVLTNAFAGLSLDTGGSGSPHSSRFASPRSAVHPYSPHGNYTPTAASSQGYPMGAQPFLRHNYPPVNPADQNPPCNTLYVGNLPIDTSEDELKALFSKQRGYKRLCFRTKQNGPMCFVEFEDISFATKALNELYGVQLHNSVKGGIRLSFSKNPLGVRAGQPGSNHQTSSMSASGPMVMNSIGAMSPAGYPAINGPPPGLSVPPGLNMQTVPSGAQMQMMNAAFVNQGRPMVPAPVGNGRGLQSPATSTGPNVGGTYPDYMMGR